MNINFPAKGTYQAGTFLFFDIFGHLRRTNTVITSWRMTTYQVQRDGSYERVA